MLDTAALIAWPISELTGGLVVIHQEQELIRISPDRAALLDSMGLVFCQPNHNSIALVSLALERSAPLITDDYRMQNIATLLGIEWQGVSQVGISAVWSWSLICSGCGIKFDAPESTNVKRKQYGDCRDCGSALRLKKKK